MREKPYARRSHHGIFHALPAYAACLAHALTDNYCAFGQAEGVGTWEAPWSCSQYVMCGPGTADAMPCADGTLWDSGAVTCNTAAQVNCAGRP